MLYFVLFFFRAVYSGIEKNIYECIYYIKKYVNALYIKLYYYIILY